MRITIQLTDEVILKELGGRFAKARLNRNLTQAELAERAGVSKRTIERLEAGHAATQLSSIIRLCRALELVERLDTLIPEATPNPITLLKLRGRERRRASSPKETESNAVGEAASPWTWGAKA